MVCFAILSEPRLGETHQKHLRRWHETRKGIFLGRHMTAAPAKSVLPGARRRSAPAETGGALQAGYAICLAGTSIGPAVPDVMGFRWPDSSYARLKHTSPSLSRSPSGVRPAKEPGPRKRGRLRSIVRTRRPASAKSGSGFPGSTMLSSKRKASDRIPEVQIHFWVRCFRSDQPPSPRADGDRTDTHGSSCLLRGPAVNLDVVTSDNLASLMTPFSR